MKNICLFSLLCTLLTGCFDSPPESAPFEVHYDVVQGAISSQPVLVFKALEDSVTINQVIVNRGNCKTLFDEYKDTQYSSWMEEKDKIPFTVKFGQVKEVGLARQYKCNVTEIQVFTDKDSWIFSF